MKKIVSINCKACGAPISVDSSEETVRCSYCDSVNNVAELLHQTDEVQIEKIKAKAYKEVEMQKYEREQNKAEIDQYKKSKLSKWTKIWAVVSLLCGVAFFSRSFLCFLIALIQCACLVVSYLMGMKIIPEKKKSLHTVLAFAGFLLTIVFFLAVSISGGSSYEPEKVNWEDTKLSELINKPDVDEFDSYYDWTGSYSIDANNVTEKQYYAYIEDLKSSGYNIETNEDGNNYEAFNSNGYQVVLRYYSSNKELSIDLNKPIEVSNITWPSSELVSKIPTPKSSIGKINSESDKSFRVYVKIENSDDYSNYVTECIDTGFNVDYERSETRFSGKNEFGDSLSVIYKGFNIMEIEIEKSETPVVEETKNTEQAKENTDVEVKEEKKENDSSVIRPEIKSAIDSYETFVDEYCVFINKYSESSDASSLLGEYSTYMIKLADFESKMDALDNGDLNPAEDAYYTEVLLRCSQKMLKIATE